jgi:hypothetical protein
MSAVIQPSGELGRKLADSINKLAKGRIDAYGTVTLLANQTTTTVTTSDAGVSVKSTIVLTPRTANAAAEIGAGTLYVSAKGNGSFTITHANNAQTDRTYDFAWIG